MRTISPILGATLVLLAADTASAQRPGRVVQLPTLSQFSVDTTVSVPDQGGGYLGGMGYGGSGIDEFGSPLSPWRNSALGSQGSVSGAFATATIHDFRAMDEALLSQPTAQWGVTLMGPAGTSLGPPLGLWTPGRTPAGDSLLAGAGNDSPAMSVAEARAQRQREQEAQQLEGQVLFNRGLRAEQSGKPGLARVYYKMAARRADGELQREALAKLASLQKPEAGSAAARRH